MVKTAKKAAAKKAAKPARKPAAKAQARTGTKVKAKPPAKTVASSPRERQRFTLHGNALSGPSYTVALMLSLCRHPYSYIHVNLREGQHKQPDYLVKNRYGQVPALRDGHAFVVQSAAIITYLADELGKFGAKQPLENQRIREWLFWSWDKLATPLYRLRARNRGIRQFGEEVRLMYDTEARAALAMLEQELLKSDWIAGRRPTIADIGIYAAVRYAPEAHVDLAPYPRLTAWKQRVEGLPGFATPEELLPLESRLI
jgi:glutathione S-transferase